MESQTTKELRERIRKYTSEQRDSKRAAATDISRFGLGVIQLKIKELVNITSEDVLAWATALKHQRHATEEDMYRLSHAFLQSEENIKLFAHSGAISIIVKELTGHDAARQVAAIKLLCNLSLGDAAACDRIATATGSYLVTYLDSMDGQLKRTALWTITNIMATGGKGAHTLLHMELVAKLWSMYEDSGLSAKLENNHGSDGVGNDSDDYRQDAAECLVLITRSPELLSDADRLYLHTHFTNKNPTCPAAEYHMEILFNCGLIGRDKQLEEMQLLYVINYCIRSILHNDNYNSVKGDRRRILYAVRMLANSLASQGATHRLLLQQLYTTWQTTVLQLFNKLFAHNDKHLTRESLWLLGNFLACEKEQQTGFFDLHKILDRLKIPC